MYFFCTFREYEILQVLEFSSARKRMSVVVREPYNKRILLFTKGADSVIFPRLSPEGKSFQPITERHLIKHGEAGLRTLVLAYREIPEDLYQQWEKRFRAAKEHLGPERADLLESASSAIEQDLVLVGTTAVEDKLQAGVPEAIDRLAQAGIKIWVLTGDKLETAINIGYACSLLRHEMVQVIITLDSPAVKAAEEAGDQEKLKEVRGGDF